MADDDALALLSKIQHIVVVMMENRSFDHYLGWLSSDQQYVEEGRRRYGKNFRVNARLNETYLNPFDVRVPTRHALDLGDDPSPYRGCNHKDPGHGWFASCKDSEGNEFHLWQSDESAA